jgi:hypothetical protein
MNLGYHATTPQGDQEGRPKGIKPIAQLCHAGSLSCHAERSEGSGAYL